MKYFFIFVMFIVNQTVLSENELSCVVVNIENRLFYPMVSDYDEQQKSHFAYINNILDGLELKVTYKVDESVLNYHLKISDIEVDSDVPMIVMSDETKQSGYFSFKSKNLDFSTHCQFE